nr:hypothetical protein [Tanacetum cinerariifolium]
MVSKSKDWVKRLNPDSKLLNFNTGRILVPESEAMNKCLQLIEGASSIFEVMTLAYQDHSSIERSGLGTMTQTKPKTQESSNKIFSGPVTIFNPKQSPTSVPTKVKTNDQESKIYKLTKLIQMLMDEKINSNQKPSEPKSMSSQPESSNYDHFTLEHNRVIQIKGGVVVESSQSSESSVGGSYTTYGSNVHLATDYNDFEHFKRGEKLLATKAKEPTKK